MGIETAMAIVPEGYREVLYWKLSQNRRQLALLNLAGIPLLLLAGALFYGWGSLHQPGLLGADLGAVGGLWSLVALALTLVLHELVHGLAIHYFGGRAQYGVIWRGLMFYATAPGYGFQRNQYLVVALAPLVVISLVGLGLLVLPLPAPLAWLAAFAAMINAAGAVGDMWIGLIVLRYPHYAVVVDEKDGMRVLLPG
jgi:hypothetical protein